MSNERLNEVTRTALMQLFRKSGIKAVDTKIRDLLIQCETWRGNTEERGTIKGELSEVALECHLLWWMQILNHATCIKSLCIKSKTSRATAEIDILLATPYRMYLFECKSFVGDKTLTKECFLQGKSSSKDVYEQSRYHLEILEQHLCSMHAKPKSKVSPYQFVLFELSSDEIDDQREEKWKHTIPALTLDTLDEFLRNEFTRELEVQWDYARLVNKLAELEATSKEMFEFHMKKIKQREKRNENH